jgi:hypothetical protein
MANVEGKRIYDLTDEQVSYDKDIFVVVDDATFTSGTKKMAVGNIYSMVDQLDAAGNFNPATALLRLNVSAGNEKQVTVEDLLQDTDVVDIIKVLGSTGWKTYALGDITKDSSKVDANTLVLSVISILGIVYFTGVFDTTAKLSENETLFTLPSSIPLSTQNQYFNASDSQTSNSDENYELYIPANTRTVKNHSPSSSTGSQAVFSVTYPGI